MVFKSYVKKRLRYGLENREKGAYLCNTKTEKGTLFPEIERLKELVLNALKKGGSAKKKLHKFHFKIWRFRKKFSPLHSQIGRMREAEKGL